MKNPALRLLAGLIVTAQLLSPSGVSAVGPKALEFKVERIAWTAREAAGLGLVPPWRLAGDRIAEAMRRLAYQKRGLTWSGKKSVFPKPVLEELAPLIAGEWARAGAHERVAFSVTAGGKKPLIKGDTFLTGEGLHWRITVLNGKPRPLGDYHLASEPWRLVPITNQHYHRRERYKSLLEDMTNWLVLPGFRPDAGRTAPPSASQAVEAASPDPAIRQKLELLDELKQEGLIGEEDHARKRRELLE